MLYMPRKVLQFKVHGQQALWNGLWEMLPVVRETIWRNLQRLRIACQKMEETSNRVNAELAARKLFCFPYVFFFFQLNVNILDKGNVNMLFT